MIMMYDEWYYLLVWYSRLPFITNDHNILYCIWAKSKQMEMTLFHSIPIRTKVSTNVYDFNDN